MADSQVRIVINAQDNASNIFTTLQKNLDKVAATLVTTFAVDFFKNAVDSAASFELQLDKVAAKGGYTAEEMQRLTNFAQEVGTQFGMTGTQSAQGLEILAAAGLKANAAIETLPSVLALAKSESVSMDTAAANVTDTLSIMGLGFNEAGRAADVLIKGANLSNTSAVEMGFALKYAGGSAKAAGYSLEETAAMIDVLAQSGIRGESAGTGLRNMLTQINDPTSKASLALQELGIKSHDVSDIIDGLRAAGDSGKVAINEFGLVAGPTIYAMLAQGSEGLKEFTTQLYDADGAAKQTATTMGQNFSGAKDRLFAIWDSLKVKLGTPVLEGLTKETDELTAQLKDFLSSGVIDRIGTNLASGLTSAGGVVLTVTEHIEGLVETSKALAELYGIKLTKDLASYIAKTYETAVAQNAKQAATQKVIAAEQELVAAMANGGTQTTRYQQAQIQLTNAMNEGGAATASLARAQTQLQTAQTTSQTATARIASAQSELNAALATGGVETQRYATAQSTFNAARTNAELATKRLITIEADLNAEMAANGASSSRAVALQQELNTARLAAQTATTRLQAAETELNAARTTGGANTQRYIAAQNALTAAQNAGTAAAAKLEAATARISARNTEAAATSQTLIQRIGGIEGAFNGLMIAFAGWTIGTMVGEWLLQFDIVKTAGTYLAEFFVKLTAEARYFFSGDFFTTAGRAKFAQEFDQIEKDFETQRDAIGKTTDKVKENQKAIEDTAEAEKKATAEELAELEKKRKAEEEAFNIKKQKLADTLTLIDDRYNRESKAIEDNKAAQIAALNSVSTLEKTKSEEATTELVAEFSKQRTAMQSHIAAKQNLIESFDVLEKDKVQNITTITIAEYKKREAIFQSVIAAETAAINEGASTAQEKEALTTSYLDAEYKKQIAAINEKVNARKIAIEAGLTSEQNGIESINRITAAGYKLREEAQKNYEEAKRIAFENSQKSEEQKINEQTKIIIDAYDKQIKSLESNNAEKLKLIDKTYQEQLKKYQDNGVKNAALEHEYLSASKKIYAELYASYASTINSMISEAQRHRDAALGYEQDIINANQQKQDNLLELDRLGMNDAQLRVSKVKELEQDLARYKEEMGRGNFTEAQKISKETEKLTLDLAKTEKQAVLDGTENAKSYLNARDLYKQAVENTNSATSKLKETEQQQANVLTDSIQNNKERMDELSQKITNIDKQLQDEHLLKIDVDSSAPDAAIERLKEPTYSTHTIYVEEVKLVPGESAPMPDGYATGGLISGKGTGTSDEIPAMLSNGEFVVTADAVNNVGVSFLNAINAGKKPTGFATGGSVSDVPSDNAIEKEALRIKEQAAIDKMGVWNLFDHIGYNAQGNPITPPQIIPWLDENVPNWFLDDSRDWVDFYDATFKVGKHNKYIVTTDGAFGYKKVTNADDYYNGISGNSPYKFGSHNRRLATGGHVQGKGTGTSDKIPAMLSNGEYVISAEIVERLGTNFFDAINFGKEIPKFNIGGLVSAFNPRIPDISTLTNSVSTQSNNIVTIEFKAPDSSKIAGQFKSDDATKLLDLLKTASNSGLRI